MQWHELTGFIDEEDMGEFETALHGKITDAITAGGVE